MMSSWPAIEAAQRHDAGARVPWFIDAPPPMRAGSVARAHLPALRRWPRWLHVNDERVVLLAPPGERTEALAEINLALRADGLIVAWRDETYPVTAWTGAPPGGATLLATLERAASRFWGSLTFGAHCNGYVAGPDGRPASVWIARRAWTKPTDPGLLDNLIGGGVPLGQSPREAVLREGWEEAGLRPHQMASLVPGRVMRLCRDIPEGLQEEELHVFDLPLPADLSPCNQDGEVAGLHCLPVAEALREAAGASMTVDASLVMLDFALRHRLLGDAELQALARRAQPLFAFNQSEVPGQGR